MEEEHYSMAELLAMEDERQIREAELEEQRKLAEKEKQKQAKENEKLAKLAEKERLANVFADKTLKCKKCEKYFIWSASEQKFFKEKGFFKPSLCKECRARMMTINNFHK